MLVGLLPIGCARCRALLDQKLHDALVFEGFCAIQRSTPGKVRGVDVDSGRYRELHGFESERFTLAAIGWNHAVVLAPIPTAAMSAVVTSCRRS